MRVRKGFKAIRQAEIFKRAQKQTAAAKELEKKVQKEKLGFWRKNPVAFVKAIMTRRKSPATP